ncbi:hypothetical protein SAMN04487895_12247 [Paenibacillus sophorae]|uniref:DUF4830 domain-containing protein n=1 Tax=Paenibacillus sophorae TaxID=1333845 RepID=A0A1H8VAJ0_9BACL|nr:hypothetical protein [Paenibacillus sophorae]SEP12311.1 hypothetical protein SAMN04487895_12247 [Paenibacillus sophorae]
MKRFSNITLIIGLVLLILSGCGKNITGDEKTAEKYVTAQGYNITSSKGEVYSYTLDKGKLFGSTESVPYQQAWGVQKAEPDTYFGKQIIIYQFTVSNHPLEKIYQAKSNLYIMLCEGKVVGGYSFPDVDGLAGAVYSLNGKTLEEVTGLSYQEWRDKWKKKYGN